MLCAEFLYHWGYKATNTDHLERVNIMAGTKATGRKATPATPKATRAPKVAVDFSQVSDPEDIKAEDIRHTRTTDLDRSPILGWLDESWNSDTGKRQTLPNDEQAEAFIRMLRSGVNRRGYGLRVVKVPQDNGSVTVEYAAVERRARKTAESEAE